MRNQNPAPAPNTRSESVLEIRSHNERLPGDITGHELRIMVRKFVGGFSNSLANVGIRTIPVYFNGSAAYTDGRHIVLPAIPLVGYIGRDDVSKILSIAIHECAHIVHTPMSAYQSYHDRMIKNKRHPKFVYFGMSLLNAIEDVRIERLFIERYPGLREHFQRLYDEVGTAIADSYAREISQNPASSLIIELGYIPISLKLKAIDINGYGSDGIRSHVDNAGKLCHLIHRQFASRAAAAATIDDVVTITDEIVEFMSMLQKSDVSQDGAQGHASNSSTRQPEAHDDHSKQPDTSTDVSQPSPSTATNTDNAAQESSSDSDAESSENNRSEDSGLCKASIDSVDEDPHADDGAGGVSSPERLSSGRQEDIPENNLGAPTRGESLTTATNQQEAQNPGKPDGQMSRNQNISKDNGSGNNKTIQSSREAHTARHNDGLQNADSQIHDKHGTNKDNRDEQDEEWLAEALENTRIIDPECDSSVIMQRIQEYMRELGNETDHENLPDFPANSQMPFQKTPRSQVMPTVIETAPPLDSMAQAKYNERMASVMSVVGPLARAIRRKFRDVDYDEELPNLDDGTFDIRSISNIALGNGYTFKREDRKPTAKIRLDILIDASASMLDNNAVYMNTAIDAAIALELATRQTSIDLSVRSYTNQTETIIVNAIQPRMTKTERTQRLGRLASQDSIHSGTPTGEAINVSVSHLIKEPHQRRMIIVLTDGCPNNEKYAEMAIQTAGSLGIEVYGIGIMLPNIRSWCPQSTVISTIEELPKALLDIVDACTPTMRRAMSREARRAP